MLTKFELNLLLFPTFIFHAIVGCNFLKKRRSKKNRKKEVVEFGRSGMGWFREFWKRLCSLVAASKVLSSSAAEPKLLFGNQINKRKSLTKFRKIFNNVVFCVISMFPFETQVCLGAKNNNYIASKSWGFHFCFLSYYLKFCIHRAEPSWAEPSWTVICCLTQTS